MNANQNSPAKPGHHWGSWLAKFGLTVLLFETISGFAITLFAFHDAVQWSVLLHTVAGTLTLLPLAYYLAGHWDAYRHYGFTHTILLGYVGLIGLAVCSISGLIITWQGFFGVSTSAFWRSVHLGSSFVFLAGTVPHLAWVWMKAFKGEAAPAARAALWQTVAATLLGLAVIVGLTRFDSPPAYVNAFPKDYHFLYSTNRPFAPSLATTQTGGAFDARSLSGSMSCGTSGCHEQIVKEWTPSAHRYAAMDPLFQGIQQVMAKQNGPESTRYCGGCHDPISLFSGTKNLFVKNLTSLRGYQEGISCLVCHGIRKTDIKGNANYTVAQSREYLWQWETNGVRRVMRDFLIRSYPEEHRQLSKRMYKAPEYCAACHKQFIDQEVNQVGWVQLQNQYDNWAASHWHHKGDATKNIECRECHMPLVDSTDPAAGDPSDYNRSPRDGKHRSHRFIASNQLIPAMLKLDGWEEHLRLTEAWLQGKRDIPEIREKWAKGPIVKMALEAPASVAPGATIPLRVVMVSNKVGHDFPTGPLDIIQSWLEVRVTDDHGKEIFHSGTRDEKHFIEPGSFLFKAEPVDQNGNLIDRHNLWEMVGVRFRRALFPGYSDTAQYLIQCPSNVVPKGTGEQPASGQGEASRKFEMPAPAEIGQYHITVSLLYRKVDQFLLNFLYGTTNQITSPVTEIVRDTATVRVKQNSKAASRSTSAVALGRQGNGDGE